jgi:outer membrane protein TolC
MPKSLVLLITCLALALHPERAAAQAEPSIEAEPSGQMDAVDSGEEPAEVTSPTLVTLEDVMERAAARSPLVAVEEARVAMAATRRFEATWNRFPRFRAELTLSPAPRVDLEIDPATGELDPFSNRDSDRELLDSVLSGTAFRLGGELSAVVPVTTFGRIRLARTLADVGVDVAEIEREAAIAESRFAAFRAFRTVQWYREVDRVLQDAEEALDTASEELEWAIDDGDRTARTSLRQLTIARTEFATLRGDADDLGHVARHALILTLGLAADFRAERLPDEFPEAEPPELETVLGFAKENRPDYSLLDQAVRAAELDQMLRMRQLTPDIFFAARVSGAYTPTVDDVSGAFITDNYNRFGYGLLLGLRWSMNPATVVARARRSEANRDVALAQRDAAWIGIEYEIAEAYFSASSRRDILLSYEAALRASEAWLNQAQFQYDQGLADFEQLREPLETYYRTMGSYFEALLRYELALADLALECGADDLRSWPGQTE